MVEYSTSVPMITIQPNPQHTGGFHLPSEGTHYVPNQYSNNALRNLVYITNKPEEDNLQESGESKGTLLNLESFDSQL